MMPRHIADISQEELQLIGGAARAMGLNEVAGEALHLRVYPGGRQWIVETSVGQVMATIPDETSAPASEQIVHLSERICRFAECFGSDMVSLLKEDDHTVVAHTTGASAAIDVIPWTGAELTPWTFVPSSAVVVAMHRFRMLLWCAGRVPSGLKDESYPRPPMWLQLGDGALELHVDWADFFPSRSTYRLSTISHKGSATVAIPHEVLETVLRPSPHEDHHETEASCTITIGAVRGEDGDRDALMIAVTGWRLILWVPAPVRERWAARVDEVLAADGIEVKRTDGVEWSIAGDFEVQVSLHHGHPDVAHVRSVLLRDVEESIELFRELGQLNAASNHIRYWLEDGVVRSAVDVQCIALYRLPGIVRQVSAAAAKYAPMLAVLSSTA